VLKFAAPIAFALMLAGCASAPHNLQSATDAMRGGDNADIGGRLAAADAAREDGHVTDALQIYQGVLVDAPGNPQSEYGVAECLLAVGKFAEAKHLFEGLQRNADLRDVALQGEGLASLGLGHDDAAEKTLLAASQVNPSLWRSWNALGSLADRRHQPDDARAFFAKAAELNPGSAAVKNNLGYSELIKGNPEHAIELFRAALALEPKSETIQNNIRLAIAATGKYDEAIREAPRDQLPVVLNNVGYVAMQRGDRTTAEGYFARAMEVSGSYATVTAKNLDLLKSEQPAKP
jgi:Flp pilus assembly protein TadD